MNREQALDFLCRLAEAIALMFGGRCETLVHDMTKPSHPILAIFNNQVSGRKVGSTADIYGNETDEGYKKLTDKDYINHFVISSSGKTIKSSTINIKGDGYWLALGINFDYTALGELSRFIAEIVNVNSDLNAEIDINLGRHLEQIFNTCAENIGVPVNKMRKAERMKMIEMLMEMGAFRFQKSVPYISERLGVSRYTVYKYIKEIEDRTNGVNHVY